jgi:hypothetical protein
MKNRIVILFLFSLLIAPSVSIAASVDDLQGTWGVVSSETLTVKGLGTDYGSSSGSAAIDFSQGAANGTYWARFPSGGLNYSGAAALIGKKGNKMNWTIDGSSIAVLEGVIEEWVEEWALSEGYPVDPDSSYATIASVICKPIKIDKATNRPVAAVITAKGSVRAYVDGDFVTKKIKYVSTITFVSRSSTTAEDQEADGE